jgi:hypothetical protein
MTTKPGFEILKKFYPMPERFRMGDPVLVREVTGMEWPQFIEALEAAEADGVDDQIVLAGLACVAFWQGNPGMRRDKARQIIERMWQSDIDVISGDNDEEEASSAGPPEAGGETPPSPSSESSSSPDAISESQNQNDSGHPGSDTGSPESLQLA